MAIDLGKCKSVARFEPAEFLEEAAAHRLDLRLPYRQGENLCYYVE